MKSKNHKNRAFLAAIAMLLVSAIVITTASFAWFTLGKNVVVSELDLKVTAKEGIVISANTSEFTDVLTREDLDGTSTNAWKAYDGNTNAFPSVISPASSSFGTGTYTSFFAGGIGLNAEGNRTMTATAVTDDNIPYYVFDVFIKYEGEQENITVNVGGSQIAVKEETRADEIKPDAVDANVEQAMRIGFVNLGTVTTPASGTAANTLIYNPKDADVASTNPVTGAGESAALADGEATVSSGKAGSLGIASAYAANATTDQAANAQMTLAKGINKIRVYIWMEGQDAMCTEAVQSQLVGASLLFEMV